MRGITGTLRDAPGSREAFASPPASLASGVGCRERHGGETPFRRSIVRVRRGFVRRESGSVETHRHHLVRVRRGAGFSAVAEKDARRREAREWSSRRTKRRPVRFLEPGCASSVHVSPGCALPGGAYVVMAITDSEARLRIVNSIRSLGGRFLTAIHPLSCVAGVSRLVFGMIPPTVVDVHRERRMVDRVYSTHDSRLAIRGLHPDSSTPPYPPLLPERSEAK